MEGINSPQRGSFKLSFGGDIRPYYHVSWNGEIDVLYLQEVQVNNVNFTSQLNIQYIPFFYGLLDEVEISSPTLPRLLLFNKGEDLGVNSPSRCWVKLNFGGTLVPYFKLNWSRQ